MSDDPGTPRELLAAEYVLGTLEAAEMRAAARLAASDPGFEAEIAHWQDRLLPLASFAAPVAPPETVWRQLEAEIGRTRRKAASGLWRSLLAWRMAAGFGYGLAAVFAVLALLQRVSPPATFALLPAGANTPGFIGQPGRDGAIQFSPLAPSNLAPDRDLQLWVLPQGAARPASLGVLPRAGGQVRANLPPGQVQVLISSEPRGGSPSGLPTGPVLYSGTTGRP